MSADEWRNRIWGRSIESTLRCFSGGVFEPASRQLKVDCAWPCISCARSGTIFSGRSQTRHTDGLLFTRYSSRSPMVRLLVCVVIVPMQPKHPATADERESSEMSRSKRSAKDRSAI